MVIGGIIVLVIALAAALAAGWIALTRDDTPAHSAQPPATVTVTATPPTSGFDPAELPQGTFTGTVTSLTGDSEGRSWKAVATFGDNTGMIAYPDQGCVVSLAPKSPEEYSSTPLTSECTGSGGTWTVDAPEAGLAHVVYVLDQQPVVEGTLSLGVPVNPEQPS